MNGADRSVLSYKVGIYTWSVERVEELVTKKPLTLWITTNCGKFLKRWEYQTMTCLLTNLYAGPKQQLELDMEQQTGSKSGKEYVKAVYCHPAYLTYPEYIMRNAGLDEAQAGTKTAGRNINNLRYEDDTTPGSPQMYMGVLATQLPPQLPPQILLSPILFKLLLRVYINMTMKTSVPLK